MSDESVSGCTEFVNIVYLVAFLLGFIKILLGFLCFPFNLGLLLKGDALPLLNLLIPDHILLVYLPQHVNVDRIIRIYQIELLHSHLQGPSNLFLYFLMTCEVLNLFIIQSVSHLPFNHVNVSWLYQSLL